MLTTTNILASHLYMLQSEPVPEAILDEEGEIDVVADDAALEEWSNRPNDFEVDQDALQRFILRTDVLLTDLENFQPDEQEELSPQYMTLFYDAAKEVFDGDKKMIRTYFQWLYMVIFHRPEGPRWGEFVSAYGVDNFVQVVRERFAGLAR